MTRNDRRRGFTLVEMLVVISIIVVLVAILFPVIAGARHKARMTRCRTNLSNLTQAMQDYKRQWHRYPPRPAYNETEQIYTGGFSALYPDFIDNYGDLVCPDDKSILAKQDEAKERRYCSYNGRINLAEDPGASEPWKFAVDTDTGHEMVTYNYYGYDANGWDRGLADALNPPADPKPSWLDRGWKYYPRLINIYAPEYTVVAHCTFHRDFYSKESEQRDTYVQINNETDTLLVETWQATDSGASMFEKQDL
jgi:prepilin-type N-terminal cleavage/methylation domain-containing protein